MIRLKFGLLSILLSSITSLGLGWGDKYGKISMARLDDRVRVAMDRYWNGACI